MVRPTNVRVLALLITYLAAAPFAAQATEANLRPFRLGVISMNREIDRVKPLAESDTGGFVVRGNIIIGSFDSEKIRAYNLETHKNVWWHSTDGELTAPPLLVESNLFFATRSGHLTAISAGTGEPLWDTELDSYIERPLTFSNGVIYVVTTGQVAYAVEASSGRRLWVHDGGFPDAITVRRPPASVVHDGRLLIGLASGDIIALKIEDGKQLWKYNPFYQEAKFKDFIGDMIIHNGKLLVSRYDGLTALITIAQERQVVWQDRQPSASTSTFRAGRLYVGLASGEILAYDASTGRINWRANVGTTSSFLMASETTIYAIGTNGRISALDIGTGAYQWGDNLGSRMATAPIVNGNQMFIATGLHNLYGYKIQ
jgi:outer membrane protein assembly factor BamB